MSESLHAARAAAPADVEVLRRRAAELARVPAAGRTGNTIPAVIFHLADENYAIDARVVLQVHVLQDLTPLAGARPPLFGITHWRGMVLTILDLREQLGVRPRGLSDLSRVIVVGDGRRAFGILADAARDVIDLDDVTVRPLPADEAAGRTLIRGITDDAVLVLDTSAVLRAGHAAATAEDVTDGGG
jgi:purine-binding chemotaxis protein CheW